MIHEVDDLRALCGEIVAVQAAASNAVRGHAVEDTVAITLRFANGALGTFRFRYRGGGASWEQTSGENAGFARYPDTDCYLLAGTRGSIGVPTLRVRAYTGERSWLEAMHASIADVERADPLVRQLEHFCAVIRGEASPLVTGRDAVRTLQVTLAISKAASSGQIITTEMEP